MSDCLSFSAECSNPSTKIFDSRNIIVVGYTEPALVGMSINLTCSSGILVGPNTATCAEDGRWKPNLRNVVCQGI